MDKKFIFVAGLPRSGSTLLQNVLAQNPNFYASATSGLVEVVAQVVSTWEKIPAMQAMEEEESIFKKSLILKNIITGFYSDKEEKVIFDKNRGWLAYLETLCYLFGRENVKVILTVRDLRDVLASFERLWRETTTIKRPPVEEEFPVKFQTVEGRCAVWASDTQPVGASYNYIKDAIHRGFSDILHFVRYEDFTLNPDSILKTLYDFIDEPYFEHYFKGIKQVTWEDDRVHGYLNLHDIKPDIEPQYSKWQEYLGDAGEQYAGYELW